MLVLCILITQTINARLFAQVKMSEETWTLPTYPVEPAEKVPIFISHDIRVGTELFPERPHS